MTAILLLSPFILVALALVALALLSRRRVAVEDARVVLAHPIRCFTCGAYVYDGELVVTFSDGTTMHHGECPLRTVA